MKVLITGGAGFIGSHLAEKLLKGGDEVFVLDDLSTGSLDNISGLMDDPGFHFEQGNVCESGSTGKMVDKCDVVYHLAAAVGVYMIVNDPVKTIKVNVKGTETVLEAAAEQNKKVIITSSSEVYGKSTALPFKETGDLVLGPTTKARWSYACSKAIDEFLSLAYWKDRKLPVVIVRLFNTTGPRQTGRYGMVVPRFVRQAMGNEPITVYGDGNQTRCFAHVRDVVRALIAIKDRDDIAGEIFNLGNDQNISIKDLAHKIKKAANSRSEICYVPYDDAYEDGFEDMTDRIPCLDKMRTLLNCDARYDIDTIISDVMEYCRNTTGLPADGADSAANTDAV